jgi:hypothetical protein
MVMMRPKESILVRFTLWIGSKGLEAFALITCEHALMHTLIREPTLGR